MFPEPDTLLTPAQWRDRSDPGSVVGVDFETFHTTAYCVAQMGTWAYCRDPRFSAYVVAVSDGTSACVCHPSEFPWETIDGLDWVSHHRDFDAEVYERLCLSSVIPARTAMPRQWHCSAALCAYLQLPRDLAGATAAVFNVTLDKSVRTRQRGKRVNGEPLSPELLNYAARDAGACLALWQKHQSAWPEHERRLFELTSAMGRHGLCLDWSHVHERKQELDALVTELSGKLPWQPAGSVKQFGLACEAAGVPVPPSTSASDPGFLLWLEEHGQTEPAAWVRDMQRIRSANRTARVLESMQTRRMPSGRMAYELKYFGATTGRWSGGGGLNLQNLNRGEAEGVDLRRAIVAPPGHKLAVIDYSQIESRVLLYLAGDTEALAMFAGNPDADAYEIHARATMGYAEPEPLKAWCDRTGSGLRQLAKARCLAGTTPVLTDRGYLTVAELQHHPTALLWDGEAFTPFDAVIRTGYKPVRNYAGEHLTEDHRVFLKDGTTRPIREIRARIDAAHLLGRNPPGGTWADVWRLGRFVLRCLSQEWLQVCESTLRSLWPRSSRQLPQSAARDEQTLRSMRKEAGPVVTGPQDMGEKARRTGSDPVSPVGRNDETLP
ncbi:MAG: hypothetical protein H7A46_21410 [Verrucomicrobiales bacterium]|nr:hypothetical protein [Verrucomicrobiales bacterium]